MCKPSRSKRIAAGDTEVPRCRSIAITSKWRSAFGCVRPNCCCLVADPNRRAKSVRAIGARVRVDVDHANLPK